VVAVVSATPRTGTAPLVVKLSAADSVDPDGGVLSYEWDYGDGAHELTGYDVSHTYAASGTYLASVTVAGAGDRRSTATVEITVSPPEPLTFASDEPLDVHPVDQPIATYDTGAWDMWEIREPGAPIFDPVTQSWICTYSGRGNLVEGNSSVTSSIGAVISDDGVSWRPHPQNPITGPAAVGGVGQGEDPYVARDAVTGAVWRDSGGRALMFTEEKDFDVHRGIALWRSAPNSLSDWTSYGRVVDRGAPGAWDATDRTSPVVIHVAGELVLLFEGRNMPAGQQGEIGMAVSHDEGQTWTVSPAPIVDRGDPGAWNDNSIVPDDLMEVEGRWVLLAHGEQAGHDWSVGRYATSADPAEWTDGSFAELAGNPLSSQTDTLMFWGADPARAMEVDADGHDLRPVALARRASGTRRGPLKSPH
jgi:PKD repeat protein